MALTDLVDLELAVPDPGGLADFWLARGLVATGQGVLGTPERPSQIRLREGAYRHVSEVRLACREEADLDRLTGRFDALGVSWTRQGAAVRCHDPILDHDVVVEVGEPAPLAPPAARSLNRPGERSRRDRRSSACLGTAPHAPRRVGHVVFGTPDVEASRAFYTDALGFRISDVVGGGLAYFLRCSTDHHNLLLMPAPVPCLNHYAVEMDDVDAIGLAGAAVVAERGDACKVTGVGRHVVGANLYWYLLDPAGGMFELFSDMDVITDDEAWEHDGRRDDWDPFTVSAWESSAPSPDFVLPADLDALAASRAAAGR